MDEAKNHSKIKSAIDEVVRAVDFVDNNSKQVTEISTVAKKIMSQDPSALDNNVAEYFIKNTFGEKIYDVTKKIYHDLIGAR